MVTSFSFMPSTWFFKKWISSKSVSKDCNCQLAVSIAAIADVTYTRYRRGVQATTLYIHNKIANIWSMNQKAVTEQNPKHKTLSCSCCCIPGVSSTIESVLLLCNRASNIYLATPFFKLQSTWKSYAPECYLIPSQNGNTMCHQLATLRRLVKT